MREIPLSRGLVAFVDDEDYEALSQWRWHVCASGHAARKIADPGSGSRQKRITMHQFLMAEKLSQGQKIRHLDGNLLNNQKGNLHIRIKAAPRAKVERTTQRFRHGMTGSRTYRIWAQMKHRCLNSNNKNFEYYGGRGISVCERWRKFENFLADMGEAPGDLTLDRYPDVDGNYEPGNCRWTTMKEQNRNRRSHVMVTHAGRTQCLSAWAEEFKVSEQRLRLYLKKCSSLQEAVETVISRKRSNQRPTPHRDPLPVPRGEAHGRAKLTDEQVRTIRERYEAGAPQTQLAKQFGVAQSHISRLIRHELRSVK